jgi:hypothetical protein
MKKRKFGDGGSTDAEEAKYKAVGLAASNAENKSSGFLGLGRFLQGNIDEKGSEAYEKYGAGLGRKLAAQSTQRDSDAPVVKTVPTVKAATTPAVSEDLKRKDRQEDGPAKTVAKPVETKMAQDASQAPLGPSDTTAIKRVASFVAKPATSGSSAAPVKQSAIAKAFSDTSGAKDVEPKTSKTAPVDNGGKPANAGPDVLTSNFSRNTQTYPTAKGFNENEASNAKKRMGSAGAKGPTYAQLKEDEKAKAKKQKDFGSRRGPTYAQLKEDEGKKKYASGGGVKGYGQARGARPAKIC